MCEGLDTNRYILFLLENGFVCMRPTAHYVRAGGDHHHVRTEAAAEDVSGLHLLLGPH